MQAVVRRRDELGVRCRSRYEFGQHVVIARRSDISEEEIERVKTGPADPTWSEHDRAIHFDDPEIGIEWPMAREALILSDKDRSAPLLADVETGF